PGSQAYAGSTSMRPHISMCSAWQNQLQQYQKTPGLSAVKVIDEVCCGLISMLTPWLTMTKPWDTSSIWSMLVMITVTSSPCLTVNSLMPKDGAMDTMYTRTLFPSRMILLSVVRLMPSASAIFTV